MWERVEVEGKRQLRDPVLIVSLSTSLSQYRAMYSHARELADYMLSGMEFTKIATLYSSALPPLAMVSKEGTLRLTSVEFYCHQDNRDIVLLAGDSSPQDEQYEFAEAVLRYAREIGVNELISIGTRWTEQVAPPTAVPRVTGFASDEVGVEALKGQGVEIVREEPAPFFASLVVGMAEKFGIRGYKISVDHGEPVPHPLSVLQLLAVLEKMVGIHLDTKALEERAQEMARDIQSVASQETAPPERSGVYG